MKTDEIDRHLAVLIDGDNVSSKVVGGLMAEVAKYGTASVRRIYGDFTSPQMKGWRNCLLEHSILPMQQYAYTTGKNATDGAMIIDAMDLLYTGRFSSFCLVSSDSDFARLAARIREQGIFVYGFGSRNITPRSFVTACNEFVYLEALPVSEDDPNDISGLSSQTSPKRASSSATMPSTVPLPGQANDQLTIQSSAQPGPPTAPRAFNGPLALHSNTRRSLSVEPQPRPIDQKARDGFREAIGRCSTMYDDDYVNLADVGHLLVSISPTLIARNYGYSRLLSFIRASGMVDWKLKPMDNGAPPIALVRLKA